MFNAANPATMLVPMLVIAALTFVAFVHMAIKRTAAVKGGHPADYYKAHIGAPEPETTAAAVRHYGNLMELPTLFYPACITAFVLGTVTGWMLIFAWSYVAARVLQSVVHMTSNNTMLRGLLFSIGVAFMIGLWLDIGLVVVSKL
jgi:hypothetical protein